MSDVERLRQLLDRALAGLEDPDANGAERYRLAELLRHEADQL
jgi:hypothetical protein